ncbi:MAG: hypothetical protein ACOC5T_05035 [Elusimicrobiota bacterium]
MSADIKKELKIFKKEVKQFRAVSQKDYDEGIKQAKYLIEKIDKFSKYSEIKKDPNKLKEVSRTKEALQLYITNVSNIKNFGKKWDKK